MAEVTVRRRGIQALGVAPAAGVFVGFQVDPGHGAFGQFIDLGSDEFLRGDGRNDYLQPLLFSEVGHLDDPAVVFQAVGGGITEFLAEALANPITIQPQTGNAQSLIPFHQQRGQGGLPCSGAPEQPDDFLFRCQRFLQVSVL